MTPSPPRLTAPPDTTGKPPSLLSRIAVAVLGQGIFHLIIGNLTLAWVPFVMAAALAWVGWKVMPPKAVAERVKSGVEHRIETSLGGLPHIVRSPEQVAADANHKEAERRRKEESEIRQFKARADLIGFHCDANWSVEEYRVKVSAAEKEKVAEDIRKKREAEEDRAKRPYLERADKIGFEVDLTWDLKTLKQQVEDAERELKQDVDHQAAVRQYERDCQTYQERLKHGPNARCPGVPGKRCGWTFRTNRTSGQYGCHRCNEFVNIRAARANWSPPPPPKEPLPPGKSPGVWGRLKGLVH